MNTPEPCDTCKHCQYDVMHEDDPFSVAWCEYDLQMGNLDYSIYKNWKEVGG